MTDKQLRAEIEARNGQYAWLGIKGEPFTDEQGRTSAIGCFRWEPIVFHGVNEYSLTGERYDFEVQVYRPGGSLGANGVLVYRDLHGNSWLPLCGEDAIRAAAIAQRALAGSKPIRGGHRGHDKTYGTLKERTKWIAEMQHVVDERYREDPKRDFIKELCVFASKAVPQSWNGKHASPNTIRKLVKNPKKKSLE